MAAIINKLKQGHLNMLNNIYLQYINIQLV